MKNILQSTVVLALVASFVGACTPPKLMVAENYLGDRYVKHMFQPAGGNESAQLANYYIQVCNIDPKTAESQNCKDSLVLETVVMRAGALGN